MTSFTDVDWEDIVKAFLIIHAAWKKARKHYPIKYYITI